MDPRGQLKNVHSHTHKGQFSWKSAMEEQGALVATAAQPSPSSAVVADEDESVSGSELVTFRSTRGSYVYAPIPHATSYGHRAELWNVDQWLREVKTKLVAAGDSMFVRLEDVDTGDLFAECPLPSDGTSLTTAVEPVVDSSRYYVLRVVDREANNHAFVGLGFRERGESSDFSAALDEYRLYLRRKREAMHMRESYEQQQQQQQQGEAQEGAAGCSPGTPPSTSLSLQGTIRLNVKNMKPKHPETPGFLSRTVSFPLTTPDSAGLLKLHLPPPPAAKPSSGGGAAAGQPGAGGLDGEDESWEVMRRLSLGAVPVAAAAAGGSPMHSSCKVQAPAGESEGEAGGQQELSGGGEAGAGSGGAGGAGGGGGAGAEGQGDEHWGDFVG